MVIDADRHPNGRVRHRRARTKAYPALKNQYVLEVGESQGAVARVFPTAWSMAASTVSGG